MPTWVKSTIAAIGAWFMDLHVMVQVLFMLMALDILTGLLRAFEERRLSSAVGRRGLTSKAMILMLVTFAEAIGKVLPLTIHIEPFGEFSIGAGLACFYCVNEALSIVENTQATLPWPRPLLERLDEIASKTGLKKGAPNDHKTET